MGSKKKGKVRSKSRKWGGSNSPESDGSNSPESDGNGQGNAQKSIEEAKEHLEKAKVALDVALDRLRTAEPGTPTETEALIEVEKNADAVKNNAKRVSFANNKGNSNSLEVEIPNNPKTPLSENELENQDKAQSKVTEAQAKFTEAQAKFAEITDEGEKATAQTQLDTFKKELETAEEELKRSQSGGSRRRRSRRSRKTKRKSYL